MRELSDIKFLSGSPWDGHFFFLFLVFFIGLTPVFGEMRELSECFEVLVLRKVQATAAATGWSDRIKKKDSFSKSYFFGDIISTTLTKLLLFASK